MLINVNLVSEGVYEWRCDVCHTPLENTGIGYYEYVLKTQDVPICWECDTEFPKSNAPGLFKNYWEFDWFFVNEFWVDVLRFSAETGLLVERVSLAPPSVYAGSAGVAQEILEIDERLLLVLLSHNSNKEVINVT